MFTECTPSDLRIEDSLSKYPIQAPTQLVLLPLKDPLRSVLVYFLICGVKAVYEVNVIAVFHQRLLLRWFRGECAQFWIEFLQQPVLVADAVGRRMLFRFRSSVALAPRLAAATFCRLG